MGFVDFCKSHGLLIDSIPQIGVWKRFPTEDHPQKRNGACKFMGDHGFVQNHATQIKVSVWKTNSTFNRSEYSKLIEQAKNDTELAQKDAARRAESLLNASTMCKHKYLQRKGFDIYAPVLNDMLLVPMRIDKKIVGCQLIDPDGEKRFLSGQKTSGAEFVFDNKGKHYFVEGYATGLSVREALRSLKQKYTIHVTFSASNLKKIAQRVGEGIVIADNDENKIGESAAKDIGFPYFLPPTVGQDFNDFHQDVGLLRASMALDALLRAR